MLWQDSCGLCGIIQSVTSSTFRLQSGFLCRNQFQPLALKALDSSMILRASAAELTMQLHFSSSSFWGIKKHTHSGFAFPCLLLQF